jgi:hypothetical protein
MKVVIAGGREHTDRTLVAKAIEGSGFTITEVVHGGCRGIDTIAGAWAKERDIPVRVFYADWKTHGKKAGPLRNKQMAEYGEALIAIPGAGNGTWNMVHNMNLQGKPICVWDENGKVGT